MIRDQIALRELLKQQQQKKKAENAWLSGNSNSLPPCRKGKKKSKNSLGLGWIGFGDGGFFLGFLGFSQAWGLWLSRSPGFRLPSFTTSFLSFAAGFRVVHIHKLPLSHTPQIGRLKVGGGKVVGRRKLRQELGRSAFLTHKKNKKNKMNNLGTRLPKVSNVPT